MCFFFFCAFLFKEKIEFFQRKTGKPRFRLVCSARAHAGALSHGVAKVAGREHPLHALLCLALSPSPCVRNPKPIDTHARVQAYKHVYADACMCSLCRMCSLYSYTHVYADASLLQAGNTPLAYATSQGHGAMDALLRQHGGT
jgi:hypothetical protein